jgi:class 3 adenylate cyclase
MSTTFGSALPVVLPEGVVTLLLADIEGSTSLWETRPDEMTTAITNYDEVVSAAIAAHGGVRPVEQGEGDSFVAAFTDASAALRCALDLQMQLAKGADGVARRRGATTQRGQLHRPDHQPLRSAPSHRTRGADRGVARRARAGE